MMDSFSLAIGGGIIVVFGILCSRSSIKSFSSIFLLLQGGIVLVIGT